MQKLLICNGFNAVHKLFTEFLQMPIDKIKSAKSIPADMATAATSAGIFAHSTICNYLLHIRQIMRF